MKLTYIGHEPYGLFAFREHAKEHGYTFENILSDPEGVNIFEETAQIMKACSDVYILDLSSAVDEEEELVKATERIGKAGHGTVIIYAPGFPKESKMLTSFRAMGFSHIITESRSLGIMKDAISDILSGKKEIISEEEQEKLVMQREEATTEILVNNPHLAAVPPDIPKADVLPKLTKGTSALKIAVVGSLAHIGTTTVCLQLVKWLSGQEEQSAAYLEFNGSSYIEKAKALYGAQKEEEALSLSVIQYVDLYQNIRKLPDILARGYSHLVYDYGSMEEMEDVSSLFEKDLILLVGGVKPNEIFETRAAMKLVFEQSNAFYVLNRVPKEDYAGCLKMQAGREDRTYFLEETLDPFVYNPDNDRLFMDLMQRDFQKPVPTAKEKGKIRRLFSL